MLRLTELPNETLGQIMGSFLCDDIDNFSVCCKRLHAVSAVSFPKHKEMKRQYSYVTYSTRQRNGFLHPLYFLQALLQTPAIASYVKTLRVQYTESTGDILNTANSLENKLQDIVQSLPYLSANENAECIAELLNACPNRCFAIIATMLPSLTKLIFHELCNDDFADSCNAVEQILIAASRPECTTRTMLLSKFSHVKFVCCEDLHQQARLIHLFGGLPSMRNLQAIRLIDSDDEWSATHSGSTLTKLVLGERRIRLESLQRILDSIAALEEFTYVFHSENREYRSPTPCKAPVEPKEIVQSLLRSASHSLVSLDLTGLGRNEKTKKGHFMGPLQGFQVLERIRVEYIMFVEHVPILSPQVYRIADVIPASLEFLTLVGPKLSIDDMSKLVDGLEEHIRPSSLGHAVKAEMKYKLD